MPMTASNNMQPMTSCS